MTQTERDRDMEGRGGSREEAGWLCRADASVALSLRTLMKQFLH